MFAHQLLYTCIDSWHITHALPWRTYVRCRQSNDKHPSTWIVPFPQVSMATILVREREAKQREKVVPSKSVQCIPQRIELQKKEVKLLFIEEHVVHKPPDLGRPNTFAPSRRDNLLICAARESGRLCNNSSRSIEREREGNGTWTWKVGTPQGS